MDRSSTDAQAQDVHVPPVRVCESSPLHDARDRPRSNWPFLYFNEDGRWYVNRAKRRSRIDQAAEVGEATW